MSGDLQRCALLLLAAGLSRRYGEGDKLLALWQGRPLLAATAASLAAVPCGHHLAVIGPGSDLKARILAEHGFRHVINPDPAAGMGTSLACGAAALAGAGIEAVFICLADMPCISLAVFPALRAALEEGPGVRVVRPLWQAQRGHPVLFRADCLAQLASLAGEEGAREVIAKMRGSLREIAVSDPGVVRDFDTPEAFRPPS